MPSGYLAYIRIGIINKVMINISVSTFFYCKQTAVVMQTNMVQFRNRDLRSNDVTNAATRRGQIEFKISHSFARLRSKVKNLGL